jgi:hypothetical protein
MIDPAACSAARRSVSMTETSKLDEPLSDADYDELEGFSAPMWFRRTAWT